MFKMSVHLSVVVFLAEKKRSPFQLYWFEPSLTFEMLWIWNADSPKYTIIPTHIFRKITALSVCPWSVNNIDTQN